MNIRTAAALIALGLGFGLGGCTTTATQQTDMSAAPLCCKSYQELQSKALPAEGMAVHIGPTDPAFNFPAGLSRFAVLELPAKLPGGEKIMVIPTITTVNVGGMAWAGYFHPVLTFLDANKNVISSFTEDVLTGPAPGCGTAIPCGATLIQTDIPANARFVALHSPSEMVGRKQEQLLGGRDPTYLFPVGGFFIPMGGGLRRIKAFGTAMGKLEVRLF